MKNRKKIFFIIGTIIFSILIFTIARQEHFIKTRVLTYQAVTLNDSKIYNSSSLKSKVIGTIPSNSKIKVAKVANGYYRILEKEGVKPNVETYILENSIKKTDTVLQY